MDHIEAKGIVDGLEELGLVDPLTPVESLFVRMVASFETNYGRGWKPGEGAGSHNWGAITFKPKGEASDECAGGFAHEDSRFDPKTGKVETYVTCFKAYEDDEHGAADVVRTVLKPNVRAALRGLSVRAGAAAMHDNKYFLGTKPTAAENVDAYTKKLNEQLRKITEATGEPDPFVAAGDELDTPLPGAPSVASFSSSLPVLRMGAVGNAVELWRELVTREAPELAYVRDHDPPDVFDVALAGVTQEFQRRHRLDVDGVVGNRETWPMMIRLLRAAPIGPRESV